MYNIKGPKLISPGHTETEIYRRHANDCKNPNRCDCPLWIYGYVRGERIRESLKTRRMDVAVDRQRRREGRDQPAASAPQAEAPLPDCSIEDAVQKYLDWVKVNSVTEGTATQYGYDFRHFTQFCASHKIRSTRALTKPLGNDLVLSLAKYAPTTRVTRFSLLRSLFGYLQDAGLMGPDPLPRRGPRPPRHGNHRPLELMEQRRILKACETPQERALVMLLLGTGLRGVDARRLRWTHLDLKLRVLRMTPQKTRETSGREVIIPKLPVDLIAALYALPRSIDSDLVFPEWIDSSGSTGNDTYRRHYMRVISRIMTRAKVEARGHDLRCTFAVERLHEGATLYDVSLLLGHSTVATTERYYAKWANKDALTERLSGVMEKADSIIFWKGLVSWPSPMCPLSGAHKPAAPRTPGFGDSSNSYSSAGRIRGRI